MSSKTSAPSAPSAVKSSAKRLPRLDVLRKQNERLRLTLENQKLSGVVNYGMQRYDVLKSSQRTKRRQPFIENESEDRLFAAFDRMRGIALCRDLVRNFTSARAALNQFRINVVGTGPKLRLHVHRPDKPEDLDTELNEQVSDWFNSYYARDCDFRGDLHLAEQCSNLIEGVKREGGQLPVFDDNLIEDTGKLLWYEADQLVEISDIAASGSPWAAYENEQGVIFDVYGRELAYACTRKHGRSVVPFAEATIFPRTVARYIRHLWRFNQKVPIAEMLSVAADLQDLYEMRGSEMQTAKRLSQEAGVVYSDGVKTDVEIHNQNNDTGKMTEQALPKYERLEALTGGRFEYLDKGDKFEPVDFNRPGVNFATAFDFILRSAGSALGLSKTYTTLNTEASYTAFRGDLLLSWAQFQVDQKFLERKFCDWVAVKAITWGIRTGALRPVRELPEGWEHDISWKWPTQPAVDPLKEAQAAVVRMANLLSTLGDEVGPDFKKNILAARDIINAAGDDVPLLFFEGKAGGAKPTPQAEEIEDSNGDDDTEEDDEVEQ